MYFSTLVKLLFELSCQNINTFGLNLFSMWVTYSGKGFLSGLIKCPRLRISLKGKLFKTS